MSAAVKSGGRFDFSGLHDSMQRVVDGELLSGVSSAILVGREVVDLHCTGLADREQGIALREDHLFRMFSSTKLVTSCAVLLLMEDGALNLDDPIERFIPQLGHRKVLKPGAQSLADTEPARSSITVRHLLCHSSGLGYGLLDPGTVLYKAFIDHKVRDNDTTLAEMIDLLEGLPLAFHPGTSWAYSIATDVLARLVEVVSGQRFDEFLAARIFEPLGMRETGFAVPPADLSRLVGYYRGASLSNPLKPGLTRVDEGPFASVCLRPVARLSGGGGLYSSLPDTIAFMRSLIPGGPTLLKPETLGMMMRSHLPEQTWVGFPKPVQGKAFGLGGAVTLAASSIDPPDSIDEFQWGGMAGTHWWINPRLGIAGIVMAQRDTAFWHPFSFEMKRQAYRGLTGR